MDYPNYQANGWLIGSGVGGVGLPRPWSTNGSSLQGCVGAMLAPTRWVTLRALFRSEPGQWDAFWRRLYLRTQQKTRQNAVE